MHRSGLIVLIVLLLSEPTMGFQYDFLHDRPVLMSGSQTPFDSTLTTMTMDVALLSSQQDTINGRIRLPREKLSDGKYPVAILIVGIETGRDVVRLVEGPDSLIVFGMDYPFAGSFDFSGWKAFETVADLREMGIKAVPQISLALDWLSNLAQADTTDITLIAVSFGVFIGLPAAALDKRIDRVVVVQAGGNLSSVLSANAERLDFPLPSWLAGKVGEMVLSPFEPNDYVGMIAPRKFLLVSGESDRFFPMESIQTLFDHANEPKEWIRHSGPHVMPSERELILELTHLVTEMLYKRRN